MRFSPDDVRREHGFQDKLLYTDSNLRILVFAFCSHVALTVAKRKSSGTRVKGRGSRVSEQGFTLKEKMLSPDAEERRNAVSISIQDAADAGSTRSVSRLSIGRRSKAASTIHPESDWVHAVTLTDRMQILQKQSLLLRKREQRACVDACGATRHASGVKSVPAVAHQSMPPHVLALVAESVVPLPACGKCFRIPLHLSQEPFGEQRDHEWLPVRGSERGKVMMAGDVSRRR